jgi:hypothetical protein
MVAPKGKKGAATKPLQEIELHLDARFQQAVHAMAKAGPQHRIGGAESGPKHKRTSDSLHQKKK